MRATRRAGPLRRRFRGDVSLGVGGQGSAAPDRAGNGTARFDTASGEDPFGGLETREGESFEFLGCTIRKKRSIQRNPRRHFMQRWPSRKATKRLRERVRELTDKRQSGKDVKQIIAELTPVLRGWGNYFRSGNADGEFNTMDSFVRWRLVRWQYRQGG